MNKTSEIGYVYWMHLSNHSDMNTEGYIGITNNIENRWGAHKSCKGACIHLENAILKYGWEDIKKDIIYTGKYIDCEEIEHYLRNKPGIGWNIRAGGGSTGALSEQSKIKISNANKGNLFCLGRKLTEETKDKIRNSRLGTTLTEKHKSNISKGLQVKVLCLNTGVVFDSIKLASEWCFIKNPSTISSVCLGKRKSAGKHPETGEKLIWEHYQLL